MANVPGVWCDYARKHKYRTEQSCRAGIMFEDRQDICVPYRCRGCMEWHMTSREDTVREYRERNAR